MGRSIVHKILDTLRVVVCTACARVHYRLRTRKLRKGADKGAYIPQFTHDLFTGINIIHIFVKNWLSWVDLLTRLCS